MRDVTGAPVARERRVLPEAGPGPRASDAAPGGGCAAVACGFVTATGSTNTVGRGTEIARSAPLRSTIAPRVGSSFVLCSSCFRESAS